MTRQSMECNRKANCLWNTLTRHFLSLWRSLHTLQTQLYYIWMVCRRNQTGRFVLYRTYSITPCRHGANDGTRSCWNWSNLQQKSNYPEYGISGRCNYITERGVRSLGLSGNKAQHADLTVELGFSSDMGVTNSRYPEEICEGQIQVNQGSMMGFLTTNWMSAQKRWKT